MIAVDPGKSGGVVWGTSLSSPSCSAMPSSREGILDLIRSARESTGATYLHLEMITGYMSGMTSKKEDGEKVGVSPKSMFTFGKQVAYIEMAATCLGLTLIEWQPAYWMRLAGISTLKRSLLSQHQWKAHLQKEAKKRFPRQAKKITLKTSDAFLIYYAAIKNPEK